MLCLVGVGLGFGFETLCIEECWEGDCCEHHREC